MQPKDNTDKEQEDIPTQDDIDQALLSGEITPEDAENAGYDASVVQDPSAVDPSQTEDPNAVAVDGAGMDDQAAVDPTDPNAIADPNASLDQTVGQYPEMEPEPIVNDMRDIKLYDLFSALVQYMQYFSKAICNVEQDQLTAVQNGQIYKDYQDVKKTIEDVQFYMENEFENNEYHKNLYTYLLFNKHFAELVKHVRTSLRLNSDTLTKKDEDSK